MGNRAVITFSLTKDAPCIYLQWLGGRASVLGFLKVAKALNLNAPLQGKPFCSIAQKKVMDEFAETLAKFFFGTKVGQTVYRDEYGCTDADNWDNGTYLIDQNFDIVGRMFMRRREEIDGNKSKEIFDLIMQDIKNRQPEKVCND